jgi:16S rRNA (guanine527-N7)-methyltransferase
MLKRHVLDCLACLPWVRGPRLLDIGSGAGLPGLLLAIVSPDLDCTLVDARTKKVAFLTIALHELGLGNARALHLRVEDLPPASRFETVTARAVTALPALWELARPWLAPGGRLLALSGHLDPTESGAVERGGGKVDVHRLRVPGLSETRHLVVVEESLSLPASPEVD